MIKHLLLIIVSAAAALTLVWVTNRDKFAAMSSKDSVLIDAEKYDDPSDEPPAAITMKAPDPGQRKEIAEFVEQIATFNEDEWLKSFVLTDSHGKELSSQDLKGQPYIANFFYTTCPSSCRQQTDHVKLLQNRYRDQPVRFVSISVHPAVDTPEILQAYADNAGAIDGKWFFLTGDMKQISRVANDVFLLGGVAERGHPDRLCLVGSDGKLVGKYNWKDPEEMRHLNEHLQELLQKQDTPSASVDSNATEG